VDHLRLCAGAAANAAIPRQDPASPAIGATIDRLRAKLHAGTLVGGAVAENHDLQAAPSARTPVVIGIVLGLGFLLLVVALQAPLLAAVGVLTNLLATGAAFGVAEWIFQDGALHSLLGFQPQGFLDPWGPRRVFTFALSGPLPPKEMGIILGIAVLLDAALIRLLLLPVLLRLMGSWAW
jgi:RND superfamily putative drug exporter